MEDPKQLRKAAKDFAPEAYQKVKHNRRNLSWMGNGRLPLQQLKRPSKRRIPVRTGLSPIEVCRKAKRLGIDRVVLAFSGGKDSLAGWCVLKDAGIEVVPVMKVYFPDLDLDANTAAFYSKFFGGVKIHMVLHPWFYAVSATNIFADPVTVRINEKLRLKSLPDNDTVQERFKAEHGLTGVPTCMCTKKGDSSQRMMAIHRRGGEISTDRRFVYPMANSSDNMAYKILIAHKCPLPSFYLENFESRDSLRITTLDWIRTHAPNDWAKIKFWCPLIEAEYRRLGRKLETRGGEENAIV